MSFTTTSSKTTSRPSGSAGTIIFVVGLQDGDEGKGKIVDLLAQDADAVARGNGGKNAGHQIVNDNGQVIALHQVPSGIKYPGKMNVIGNGVLVDPIGLKEEIADIRAKGCKIDPTNLAISDIAHMVQPKHKALDAFRESGKGSQGSTKSGIAFAESDKRLRSGYIRVEAINLMSKAALAHIVFKELCGVKTRTGLFGVKKPAKRKEAQRLANEFAEAAVELKDYIKDTSDLLNTMLENGKTILLEGAQAMGLDPNHGKYPFTTSTGCTVPALLEGTGVNPKYMGRKVGVVKLRPSKVGGGVFVTKIEDNAIAEAARGKRGSVDGEYGATTERPREVGYLDLVRLKRAVRINGIDELAVTKADGMQKSHGSITRVAVAYTHHGTDADGHPVESQITVPPSSSQELAKCTPIYKEFPTWADPTSEEAEDYLKFIEEYLNVPITIVSYGPERDQILYRSITAE